MKRKYKPKKAVSRYARAPKNNFKVGLTRRRKGEVETCTCAWDAATCPRHGLAVK